MPEHDTIASPQRGDLVHFCRAYPGVEWTCVDPDAGLYRVVGGATTQQINHDATPYVILPPLGSTTPVPEGSGQAYLSYSPAGSALTFTWRGGAQLVDVTRGLEHDHFGTFDPAEPDLSDNAQLDMVFRRRASLPQILTAFQQVCDRWAAQH